MNMSTILLVEQAFILQSLIGPHEEDAKTLSWRPSQFVPVMKAACERSYNDPRFNAYSEHQRGRRE
jgi:hypothetical protein